MSIAAVAQKLDPRDQPVLVHEMRTRLRGARPFVVMFIYVAVLSFIALLVIAGCAERHAPVSANTAQYYQSQGVQVSLPEQGELLAMYGKRLFYILSFTQLVMIALIVPSYSAGAVTTERERGTFDLLSLTLLRSGSIVGQKLGAAVAQTLMLMAASTPVLGVVFMLGGVSPGQVAIVYAILLATAVMLGSLGVLCSCFMKNSRSATFMAYLSTLLFLIGIPLCGIWFRGVASVGLGNAAASFPLIFTFMFMFSGAIVSLVMYGIIALALRKSVQIWKTRAFRMAVFGGVYAGLLLVMSNPLLTNSLVDLLWRQGIFLPLYVNPFFALSMLSGDHWILMYSWYNTGYAHHSYYGYGSPYSRYGYGSIEALGNYALVATLVFAAGSAYLFRQISAARLEAMRRA